MPTINTNILDNLDKEDTDKVSYFLNLLINQSKYKNFQNEISLRKEEIKNKEIISHKDIWNDLDV